MDANSTRPLKEIAEAFSALADDLKGGSDTAGLRVAVFASACDQISVLFGCLGIAFKFAEKDYVSKVKDLGEAAKEFDILPIMIDGDINRNTAKDGGSHTRNLLRVKRGVDMVRVLFQQILVTQGNSLRHPASTAYDEIFAPHHSWAIRKAVAAGMYVLPSKSSFLTKLNEKEESAREYMETFVNTAEPVTQYVDSLFTSKGLGVGW